jgi:hypothetical protein
LLRVLQVCGGRGVLQGRAARVWGLFNVFYVFKFKHLLLTSNLNRKANASKLVFRRLEARL